MAGSRTRSNTDETPKGIHDSEPLKRTVGDYPERPYGEAISDEHRATLTEAGFEVTKRTQTEAEALGLGEPE